MLGLKLYKYFDLNSKSLSVKLFNQRLPLIYIIFNFFYRIIKVNPKIDDEEILKFHNSGFVKINISLKDEINEFKDKFFLKNEDKKNKKRILLELEDKDKKILITKIKKKLSPFLNKLENYFNCDCIISDVEMWRNYNHDDKYDLSKEHFNNHFHQDSYLMTYNKIFVNLMDINEEDGPLEVIPRENRSSFVKSFNYKDRHKYDLFGDQSLIKKNTGKLGNCCLFSSSQIFHRAGVPKNHRDNMQIILIIFPKKYSEGLDKIDDIKLFDNNFKSYQKFTKPYNILKVIRLFFTLLKYKKIHE